MSRNKQLVFTLLFLCFYISSYSLKTDRSASLNSSLEGDVYFITIFVDTKDGSWEPEEIEHYYNEFEKSQTWIQGQADNFEKEINFINDFFFFDNQETVYFGEIKRGNDPIQLVENVVDKRGYDNFKDFLEDNGYEESVGKLKIILFVKSNGRSHAYNNLRINNVDIAIVYFRSTYGLSTDNYVISHEILHQFGAWDLYHGKSQTLESAKKAIELYPNSVMINTRRNKSKLEIDELTAWRIGWKKNEPEYAQFNPRYNNSREEFKRSQKKDGISFKFDLNKKKKKKKKKEKQEDEN